MLANTMVKDHQEINRLTNVEEKRVLYNLCNEYNIGYIVKTSDMPLITKFKSFNIFVSLCIM